ncbi:GntR family transcriptional regulator [Robertmurraya massiliosenegalensis]|uniref:GntR family transcriptional regulator n=1 Tax=Robertmurraya massiliosenegalensis TaxID=1287657 RepID=UPI00031A47DD|nr:GntR family transcriptional regulator [Robertmurraya massiliosenegalensis]
MNIKFNNRDPVYVQVIRHFKEQMATGLFEPGQEIPSRRELANQLKINPNTAQRAYKEMEEQGLIFTEGNLPSRMTTDEKTFQMVRNELILEAVDAFVDAVRTIKVPLDEVLPIVEQKYKNESYE